MWWRKFVSRPTLVLEAGFTHAQEEQVEGSSTALVVTLLGSVLHGVNLGDSGLVVVRDGMVVYRTVAQQISWNCPFQLGHLSQQRPEDGIVLRFEVLQGDVVIAGTDGLFDNLFDHQLAEAYWKWYAQRKKAAALPLASVIALEAAEVAANKSVTTPYGESMYRELGTIFRGGKMDDITVVVAVVVPQPDDEDGDMHLPQPEDEGLGFY